MMLVMKEMNNDQRSINSTKIDVNSVQDLVEFEKIIDDIWLFTRHSIPAQGSDKNENSDNFTKSLHFGMTASIEFLMVKNPFLHKVVG
uniref:Uncharacterized protein n=1 Tax=Romanomermis culicivorax TaxID=13658 RepID=A0A915L856_ROMCU